MYILHAYLYTTLVNSFTIYMELYFIVFVRDALKILHPELLRGCMNAGIRRKRWHSKKGILRSFSKTLLCLNLPAMLVSTGTPIMLLG